ncbi:Cryptochrome DASH, chloroplastic/mitochondrial [Apostasia shenzhenica]|uniref:Cryptochrome DASH, chloroplastic/mitochondrial n=1 Tax=Apostasia shenzhenica TaxID=1088818 RepID=A0A2I0AYU6_9ASPA|nr:Cryptochrome DASH, chloroplastic/mitochondrial [Apostasia shenzhenica]
MVLAARLQSIPVAALTSLHSRSSSTRRGLHVVSNAGRLADSCSGAAVVWYKHDLRLDDHPGLVAAASQHRTVVPLYVFDPRMISGLSDEMLDALLIALEDLKKLLKNQGSDLFVGFGNAEDIIMRIVNDVKATQVFAEEEVDYINQRVINIVKSNLLAASFPWGHPKLVSWNAPMYDIKNMKELPTLYNTFRNLKLPVSNPITPPSLLIINVGLERGDLPTLSEVKRYLNDESWTCIKRISAVATLQKKLLGENPDIDLEDSSRKNLEHKVQLTKSVFDSHNGFEVKGGTEVALNALAAYLRYQEGTGRDDWQDIHDKMQMAERRNGASFSALFGASLYLGTISKRRVHYEAIKYEKERNAGFLSPFGYSTSTVAAAIESVCSMEWYWLLALKSQFHNEETCSTRIWRWRGFLIQYTEAGDEGPPILFVHGFGAFLEHFRENIYVMAKSGHRVWGVTLLGFGRSEKPNVLYSELMWAELLRDFIVDLVKEPVHLVGNSIGGYFVASAACLWPALVKSLVLINSAGKVVPDYIPVPLTELSRTSGVAWIGSRLLLLYLRFKAADILKKCYPTNPDRVDDWLVNEILRAVSSFKSYDPGVTIVLESVFNFKLPVPINYLLESFGGKVIVIQVCHKFTVWALKTIMMIAMISLSITLMIRA